MLPTNEANDETIYRKNNPDEPTNIDVLVNEEQWNKMHCPALTNRTKLKIGWMEV